MSWGGTRASSGYDQSSTGEERRSDILKLILYDLNSAIAPHDHRIMALQTAISEFDHDQDYKHDEELDHHADKILFQKLAFAFQVDRSSEEVAMICSALEMVYRASRPRVALSFAELRECVLPIFVEMLGKPMQLRKLEALDVALKAQAERLDSQRGAHVDYQYSDHGDQSVAHRSDFSGAHPSSYNTDEMSQPSAGNDDSTHQSYQSLKKPYKAQPYDASYMSYDDGDEESLQKPSKQFDDSYADSGYSQMIDANYGDEMSTNDASVRKSPHGNADYATAKNTQYDDGAFEDSYLDAEAVGNGQNDHQMYEDNQSFANDHQMYEDNQSYANDQQTYEGNQSYANDQQTYEDTQSYGKSVQNRDEDAGNHGDRINGIDSFNNQRDEETYGADAQSHASFGQGISKGVYESGQYSVQSIDQSVQQEEFQPDDGSFADYRSFAGESYHDPPIQKVCDEIRGDEISRNSAHDQVASTQNQGYENSVLGDKTVQMYEHDVEEDDQGTVEIDDRGDLSVQNDHGDSLNESKYAYEPGHQSAQSIGAGIYQETLNREDCESITDYQSFAGESYQDAQSQRIPSNNVGNDEMSYVTGAVRDNDAYGEGQTRGQDVERNNLNDVDEDGYQDRSIVDATFHEPRTPQYDDESVAMQSQYAEEGEPNDERSTQQAGHIDVLDNTMKSQYNADFDHDEMRSKDANQHGDMVNEQNVSDQSIQSQSAKSLQSSFYQRVNAKNQALDDSQSYNGSQTDDDDRFHSQNYESTGSFISQYSDNHSVKKPFKGEYDVETVYSQDDDDRSRDASLVSEGSFDKTQTFNDSLGKPLKSALGNLSTVEEELNNDSTPSFVTHTSTQDFNILKTSGPLQTLDENESMQSGRTVTSSAARSVMERKIENDRRTNEQVAMLEAELQLIRVEDPTNPVGVSRTLQVLRYFSRVLSAMVPMAHHPGLLDALVYQLERQEYGRHADHFNHHDDGVPRSQSDKDELASARVDAIATIVNLACAEDNKAKMASHTGLLDVVTTVAQSDPFEEAREHAAIVIMNLAYEDNNKEFMVQHPSMLDTLAQLIQDHSPFTRRYASAALFTLACVVGNSEKMAVYCDGKILECLRRVLADDPVDEARINAAEALFNMSRSSTEDTLHIMGDHPNLLATLAKAVLTDFSADARIFCARALEWMSAGIHSPANCHRLLLSALTVSTQWTKTSCIAEALKTQATLPENRYPMAAHDGLLQALSNLALLESLHDTDVRKNAIAALEMISRSEKARQYMAMNEQVMKALMKASFEYGDENVFGEDGQGVPVTNRMLKEALKNLAGTM